MDLLQSKKINLVTARKLLQEIISGNPESPSEVGGSTKNINIYIYIYIYIFLGGGGVVCKSLCVECRTHCMAVEVTLTGDPLPITPHH